MELSWEEDPNIFIFKDHTPGKHKMHTKRLNLNNWVRIDSSYIGQMKVREKLLNERINDVFITSDNLSTNACKWELFELLVEYLPKRFPQIFERSDGFIYNKVLKNQVSTVKNAGEEDPLVRASRMTQEDWLVMEWDELVQGYVLRAGVLCFPMRWTLEEKFNKVLVGIHEPVQEFLDHLAEKVNSLLFTLKPFAPIWRANWGIYHDLDGLLDLFVSSQCEKERTKQVARFDPKKTGDEILLRCEYQTLRKLPVTKCIIFSIRTYQRCLKEFWDLSIEDSEALESAIEALSDESQKYKRAIYWGDATLKYLRNIITTRRKKNLLNNFPVIAVICAASAIFLALLFCCK